MTGPPADATELLERALGYAAGSLALVRSPLLSRPTPCAGWDLRALLAHMNDSLLALLEATGYGWVAGPGSGRTAAAADPVASLRERACALLARCAADAGPDVVAVGDRWLAARAVAAAGALEIAVHGWDVARACGADRPLPPPFAVRLLEVSSLLVDSADRPARFAPPLPAGGADGAGVRLLAFLGRDAQATAGYRP
ncbi:TIGR03086 family metal-binding protein [Jiangella rhizosphaerae]|uniref:TIGR03086 family protein n=1 Tax=Jiangella rhizosphaerae TaxID=2293569 RepID=A0A418KGW1_9ACTN|nr:TIGR03086 family metal-binding protein [Jiangella rhizosphaerae]RIQ11183.1 TIGR03086 family protein [Jiangella rhizosphaerae]